MSQPPKIKNGKIAIEKTLTANANISKISKDKKIFHEADKFLDIRGLFSKSKIDLRSGLTPYQKKKIKSALFDFSELAGGPEHLVRDFAPAIKTQGMKKYMAGVGLPKNARGILLQGGAKINSKIRWKDGGIHFLAGAREQSQYPLDATTEETLIESIKKLRAIINQKNSFSYVGTHGGKIATAGVSEKRQREEAKDATELLTNVATEIYNKYLKVVLDDENRGGEKTKRTGGRYYAHPTKWGMVLISEPTDDYENDDEEENEY